MKRIIQILLIVFMPLTSCYIYELEMFRDSFTRQGWMFEFFRFNENAHRAERFFWVLDARPELNGETRYLYLYQKLVPDDGWIFEFETNRIAESIAEVIRELDYEVSRFERFLAITKSELFMDCAVHFWPERAYDILTNSSLIYSGGTTNETALSLD